MNELSKLTLLDETEVHLRDDTALHEVSKEIEGNPIEITDGASAPMVKCVTEIQGSQDLHGYDKPWVGGAGKNKLENIATTTTVNGVTFTVNADGTVVANGTATGGNADLGLATLTLIEGQVLNGSAGGNGSTYGIGISGVGIVVGNGDHVITASESGNKAVYIRVMNGKTVSNVTFYPMLRESGTTADFAPYSNICPITAYDEGEIEVRGKNLIPMTVDTIKGINTTGTWSGNSYTVNGVTFTILTDGNGNVIGVEKTGTASQASSLYLTLSSTDKSGESYILTGCPSGGGASSYRLAWYNHGYDSGSGLTSDGSSTPRAIVIEVYTGNSQEVTFYPMLRYSSVQDGTFAPYIAPITHTTTYPSAIYRGSEDCVEGEVNYDMPVIDLGDLTWTKDGYNYRAPVTGIKRPATTEIKGNGVCSHYPIVPQSIPTDNSFSFLGWMDGIIFWGGDGTYETVEDFSAAMSGVMLAYELATPTTSSVTPTNLPIKSLSGYNHIESSTGDMEIEYITQDYQPLLKTTKKQIYEELPFTIKNGKLHVIYNK